MPRRDVDIFKDTLKQKYKDSVSDGLIVYHMPNLKAGSVLREVMYWVAEKNRINREARDRRLKEGQGLIRPIRIFMEKFQEFWEEVMSEDDYIPTKLTYVDELDDGSLDIGFAFGPGNNDYVAGLIDMAISSEELVETFSEH